MRAVPEALLVAALLLLLADEAIGWPSPWWSATREGAEASYRLPDAFLIGASSSAYQTEGAWNVSGKGASTVDFAYNNRSDGGGQVACDSYHHYKEDVAMLKLMGATHYRFSFAWARLLPSGEVDDVNEDGVRFYSALLDELLRNGIEPLVTLWHVDTPMALERAFGGWQDERIVAYFETYATTAFRLFGDRVKYWTTLNEPHMFCVYGAGHGRMGATRVQPGRSEYLCGHHMLLAHAAAYRIYRRDFAHQGGRVGITVESYFTRPCSQDADDAAAAERHQQFELGWFLDPILGGRGDYPAVMRQRVADRLPVFTERQRTDLQGSLDFIGLNSYYGWSACDGVPANAGEPSFERDQGVVVPEAADMNLPPSNFQWSPWGIRASLLWMRDRYGPAVPFLVTENGYTGGGQEEGLRDASRVAYISAWLREVLRAVHEDRVDVIGYFVWSLLDNFEWGAGYIPKLGLVHVDFESAERTRTPKSSLFFMRDIIANRTVPERPRSSSAATLPALSPLFLASLFSTKYIIF